MSMTEALDINIYYRPYHGHFAGGVRSGRYIGLSIIHSISLISIRHLSRLDSGAIYSSGIYICLHM